MKTLIFLSVLFTASSFAQICGRSPDDLNRRFHDESARIAFVNDGGLFNGGVCWWHSRLQRSSVYLAQFAPEKPRPTDQELHLILQSLKTMKRVITIPGFSDFKSFTSAYQKNVQSMLNGWQAEDGFFNFEWLRGISGRSSLPEHEMEAHMQRLFTYYKSTPKGLWVMAQIKGITSHALLVTDMVEVAEGGYDLGVIDSNKPLLTRPIHYKSGQESLMIDGAKYTFVPYVGFQEDFRSIAGSLKAHCPNKDANVEEMENVETGDIEL